MSEQIDYEFFSGMEYYVVLESQIDLDRTSGEKTEFCNDITSSSKSKTQLVQTCNDFVNLVKRAKTQYSVNSPLEKSKYHKFLNYWINYKLSVISDYKEIKSSFFKHMKSNSKSFDPDNELIDKIQEIDIKYIENMKKLYDLYKHYLDLTGGNKYEKNTFIAEFKKKYNDALEKCFSGGECGFCSALKFFRDSYEDKKDSEKYCLDICPTLPELIISEESTNQLSQIAKIGTIVINDSTVTSSKGLYIKDREKYSDLIKLISLQYNLLMQNDENEKSCIMLKILYQYFQYYNTHKSNSYLEPFIEEFISKYYTKKRAEYDKMFKYCSSSTSDSQINKYCQFYKECKRDFSEELTLIGKGPDIYINNKRQYFKSIAPDNSWEAKARALFKDFDTAFKSSTTLLSIVVAFFVCLFFLYKVLKSYLY